MADKVKVELQDSNGNVYYPFTKFDCVTVDGQSVSKNLNAVMEEFDRSISAIKKEMPKIKEVIAKVEGDPQKIRAIEEQLERVELKARTILNVLPSIERDVEILKDDADELETLTGQHSAEIKTLQDISNRIQKLIIPRVEQKAERALGALEAVERKAERALRASEVSEQRITQIERRLDAAGIPE